MVKRQSEINNDNKHTIPLRRAAAAAAKKHLSTVQISGGLSQDLAFLKNEWKRNHKTDLRIQNAPLKNDISCGLIQKKQRNFTVRSTSSRQDLMILFDLEIDKENWIFFQKSLEPNTHLPLIRMESVQFLYLPSWSRIDQCINPRPGALQQLTWYIHVPMAGMQGEKNQCWYNRLTLTWLRTARPQREKPSHRKMSSSFIVSVKGSEWKRQRRSWRSNRW